MDYIDIAEKIKKTTGQDFGRLFFYMDVQIARNYASSSIDKAVSWVLGFQQLV